MDLEEIEKLLTLMSKYDLSELKIEEEKLNFSARRGFEKASAPMLVSAQMPAPAAASSHLLPAAGASGVQPAAVEAKNLKEITSPIVGTFYRKPAPDQSAFVEIGSQIGADDVVCIVEAMKVMNEIKSGISGVVRKILVEDASSVEYGQPLFLVEVG